MFCKKVVLKNFTKFTGKHLCQKLFFYKVAGLRPKTLLRKRLWHRCFPVNLAKSFLQNTSGRTIFALMNISRNHFVCVILTLLCLVVTKMSHMLKQTCSRTLSVHLQVCLSMCYPFVTTMH